MYQAYRTSPSGGINPISSYSKLNLVIQNTKSKDSITKNESQMYDTNKLCEKFMAECSELFGKSNNKH